MVEVLITKYYYCSKDGCLKRKFTYNKNHKKDERAGYQRVDGYRYIRIGSKQFLEHHLIWFLINGYFPEEIDHINGQKDDNHINNLREVSRLENMHNKPIYKNNTTGFIGVYPTKYRGKNKFTTTINVDKKRIYLGSFYKLEDAIKARQEANIKYGFHKNHGRR